MAKISTLIFGLTVVANPRIRADTYLLQPWGTWCTSFNPPNADSIGPSLPTLELQIH